MWSWLFIFNLKPELGSVVQNDISMHVLWFDSVPLTNKCINLFCLVLPDCMPGLIRSTGLVHHRAVYSTRSISKYTGSFSSLLHSINLAYLCFMDEADRSV